MITIIILDLLLLLLGLMKSVGLMKFHNVCSFVVCIQICMLNIIYCIQYSFLMIVIFSSILISLNHYCIFILQYHEVKLGH